MGHVVQPSPFMISYDDHSARQSSDIGDGDLGVRERPPLRVARHWLPCWPWWRWPNLVLVRSRAFFSGPRTNTASVTAAGTKANAAESMDTGCRREFLRETPPPPPPPLGPCVRHG